MLITDTIILYTEFYRQSSLKHVKHNQETLVKGKKK